MKVTRISPFSNAPNTMELDITQEEYDLWRKGGKLIQDVWPNLSTDEREFIMTGIMPKEWDKNFGDESYETEDEIVWPKEKGDEEC